MATDPTTIDFGGMSFRDAYAALDKTPSAARSWLSHNGWRVADGKVRKVKAPGEIQDEIAARIAAAPPTFPCRRCGARAGCEHRPTTITNGAPA